LKHPVLGCEDASIAGIPSTELLLATGERIAIRGAVRDVEKRLQDAVRSGPGTLAWLEESRAGEPVGVNPAHVVTLRSGEDA
jgi:hypothetical protein